jgi:hypothetical protein
MYFGPAFQYCEFYGEMLNCCRQAPCIRREKIKFTKNHDFNLKLPIYAGQRYIVQYRDFLPSVASEYELYVRNGNEDSATSFERFAINRAKSYRSFMDKWTHSGHENLHKLRYEDLTTTPQTILPDILRLFCPDILIQNNKLLTVISTVQQNTVSRGKIKITKFFGVKSTRSVDEFRYFNPQFFGQLEHVAEGSDVAEDLESAEQKGLSQA